MTSRLHLCRPERDPPLLAELAATFPAPSTHALAASGLLWSELSLADAARTPTLAFVEQVLPAPRAVAARSVTQWAQLLADAVLDELGQHHGPWRLHGAQSGEIGGRNREAGTDDEMGDGGRQFSPAGRRRPS